MSIASRLRFGFCLALALISAAIADPIVEIASNAGWFGAGNFTDHSSIDVVPALLAGIALLGIYVLRKAEVLITEQRPDRIAALLPVAFALQIFALYAMETLEQLFVWHHTLGPTVWLGGPWPISVAIHAGMCLAITLTVFRSKRTLATTALRVIALVRAIATLGINAEKPLSTRRTAKVLRIATLPVLSAAGERAPPLAAL